jgi:hypothetical protein
MSMGWWATFRSPAMIWRRGREEGHGDVGGRCVCSGWQGQNEKQRVIRKQIWQVMGRGRVGQGGKEEGRSTHHGLALGLQALDVVGKRHVLVERVGRGRGSDHVREKVQY